MESATAPSAIWTRGGGQSQINASARVSSHSCIENRETKTIRSDDVEGWPSLALTEAVAVHSAQAWHRLAYEEQWMINNVWSELIERRK